MPFPESLGVLALNHLHKKVITVGYTDYEERSLVEFFIDVHQSMTKSPSGGSRPLFHTYIQISFLECVPLLS